jgi:hypothetical protein
MPDVDYMRPAVYEPMPYGKRLLVGIPGSVLEELYKVGLIRISEFRPPGRRRTLRLVHMPTLLRFIREHSELTDRLVEETKREFYGPDVPPEISRQLGSSGTAEEAANP